MDDLALQLQPFPEMPDDELHRSTHWRVVMNMNQARLGSMMVIVLRDCFDVFELTLDEREDLWQLMGLSRHVLQFCFAPNNINFEFRMNRRRHVHLHITPRYFEATPSFAGLVFPDTERVVSRRMPPQAHLEIALWLRKGFERALDTQPD